MSGARVSGLRVIGAGLPRTGTRSLKAGLEQLLGGTCYHMHEVFEHLGDVPTWQAALRGESVDWRSFLAGYSAAVDWPASAFWRELLATYPDAVVVLSVRRDARTWWESVDATIMDAGRREMDPKLAQWQQMFFELLRQRLTPDFESPEAMMSAYERHNQSVRQELGSQVLEWRAQDSWAPLCAALGLPIPDEPFPYLNTREEWARRD